MMARCENFNEWWLIFQTNIGDSCLTDGEVNPFCRTPVGDALEMIAPGIGVGKAGINGACCDKRLRHGSDDFIECSKN